MVPPMPDVTICVVLTGSPVKPAVPISMAETTSVAAPCAGVKCTLPSRSLSVVTMRL